MRVLLILMWLVSVFLMLVSLLVKSFIGVSWFRCRFSVLFSVCVVLCRCSWLFSWLFLLSLVCIVVCWLLGVSCVCRVRWW